MIKSIIAAGALIGATSGAAFAGPYVNIENNTGFAGSDYQGAVTETHVGYEGTAGENANWYIQTGPAFVTTDGAGTETEFSGKAGGSVALTENVEAYTEVSFITVDGSDANYGTKAGLTYRF